MHKNIFVIALVWSSYLNAMHEFAAPNIADQSKTVKEKAEEEGLYLSASSRLNSREYLENWHKVLKNTAMQPKYTGETNHFNVNGASSLLAYVDGKYAGFIQMDLDLDHDPEIYHVFIEDEFRNRRIGTMLVAIVCELADRNRLVLNWKLTNPLRYKIAKKFKFFPNERLSDREWPISSDQSEIDAWEHYLDYWRKKNTCVYVRVRRYYWPIVRPDEVTKKAKKRGLEWADAHRADFYNQ